MKTNNTKPRYLVGTWDNENEAFTPQIGVGRSINITWQRLLVVMRLLRQRGYSAHRVRDKSGGYDCNDAYVLVERTDGMTRAAVLESWLR